MTEGGTSDRDIRFVNPIRKSERRRVVTESKLANLEPVDTAAISWRERREPFVKPPLVVRADVLEAVVKAEGRLEV